MGMLGCGAQGLKMYKKEVKEIFLFCHLTCNVFRNKIMLLILVKCFLCHSCSCNYCTVTSNKKYILSSYGPISLLKLDYNPTQNHHTGFMLGRHSFYKMR